MLALTQFFMQILTNNQRFSNDRQTVLKRIIFYLTVYISVIYEQKKLIFVRFFLRIAITLPQLK